MIQRLLSEEGQFLGGCKLPPCLRWTFLSLFVACGQYRSPLPLRFLHHHLRRRQVRHRRPVHRHRRPGHLHPRELLFCRPSACMDGGVISMCARAGRKERGISRVRVGEGWGVKRGNCNRVRVACVRACMHGCRRGYAFASVGLEGAA